MLHPGATLEFPPKEVAFVQEEDQGGYLEEFGGTDGAPEEERVFETIYTWIFQEAFVKTGNGWWEVSQIKGHEAFTYGQLR